MKSIREAFRAPDAEFSPFPFWFLNGDLNDGELERQLNDFLSHGVRAVVLHPRVGVPRIPVLSFGRVSGSHRDHCFLRGVARHARAFV